MKSQNYSLTVRACYVGYVVQAIVNNFAPLLFLTFQSTYGISLSKITLLITMNFLVQLITDLASAAFIDKIGYRASAILAHVLAASGFVLLTILPELTGDPFLGLVISVMIYAVGGGLLEVLLSPIIEALPLGNKERMMSLLHSFYCWGHVAVVLISTVFFRLFGIENWKIMAIIWAAVPAANILAFSKAPILSLISQGERGYTLGELVRKPVFWLMMLLMACAGASEQSVSQWASTFAEAGLGVSKSVGDLAGPMSFALLMGTSRLIYGKYGDKMDLRRAMAISSVLCIVSYLMIALSPWPVLGLIGCGLCGFSVGIMWPGAFSIASASIRQGGTALFALLALAGDLGCGGGPTFVGFTSNLFGGELKWGILMALVFPVLMLIGVSVHTKNRD